MSRRFLTFVQELFLATRWFMLNEKAIGKIAFCMGVSIQRFFFSPPVFDEIIVELVVVIGTMRLA